MLSLGSIPPGGATRCQPPQLLTVAMQHQAFRRGSLGILTQSADVPAIARRADRYAEHPRLGHQQVQQPVRLHLAQAPLAVADQHGGRLLHDAKVHAKPDLPTLDELDVLQHPHHAVRVVAAKIRTDQARRDDRGIAPRYTRSGQKCRRKLDQSRCRNVGHAQLTQEDRWAVPPDSVAGTLRLR